MGDIGIPELLIVLAIVVIVFGPGKIAGIGRALGTSIREFRHATRADDTEPATDATHQPPIHDSAHR